MAIAFFTPSALKPAPAPALDRTQRPRVDGRSVIGGLAALAETVGQPVALPENFGDDFAAVGRAAVKAGGVAEALAAKMAEARDIADVTRGETALDKAVAEHQAWRDKHHGTPDMWEKDLRERLIAANSSILGQKTLSPAARRELGLRSERRIGAALNRNMTESSQRTFALAADSFKAKADGQWAAKDYDGAVATLKEGQQAGYVWGSQVSHLEGQATLAKEKDTREAGVNDAMGRLARDPWKLKEELDLPVQDGSGSSAEALLFPGADNTDLLRFQGQAEREIAGRQMAMREKLQDAIATAPETVTEASLRAQAGSVKLGENDVRQLLEFRQQLAERQASQQAFDWGAGSKFNAALDAYDPATDDEQGTKYQTLARQYEVLTAGGGAEAEKTRGVWGRKLSYKHPWGQGKTDGDAGQLELFDKFLDIQRDAGAFGPVKRQVEVIQKVNKKEGKETKTTEERVWETEAHPDTARAYARAEHEYAKQFRSAIARKELNPDDAAAVEAWVAGRVGSEKNAAMLPSPPPVQAAPKFPDTNKLKAILQP